MTAATEEVMTIRLMSGLRLVLLHFVLLSSPPAHSSPDPQIVGSQEEAVHGPEQK